MFLILCPFAFLEELFMNDLMININRLSKNLFDLSQIGMNENGGIDRALGDESDRGSKKMVNQLLAEYYGQKSKN